MIKEPKLPHKLKGGDRAAARVDGVEYLIGIRVVGYTSLKRRDYSRSTWECSGRGERVEHARRFKERRQWRRVYEEAASRGILQVYKAQEHRT